LTGKKFGKLTVLEKVENKKQEKTKWLCRCDCGKTKIIRGSSLTSGNTKSCGCYAKELVKTNFSTHNLAKHPLYKIWANMKSRCENHKNINFSNYGGRGIKVCEEWQEFKPFYDWAISNGYEKKLNIDRINNDGNYEPKNCRWVSPKVNSSNKRNNINFTYKNKTLCLKEWAEELNLDYILLYNRIIKRKWNFEKAIKTPIMENRRNKNAKHR
jgi:hypothetical protein